MNSRIVGLVLVAGMLTFVAALSSKAKLGANPVVGNAKQAEPPKLSGPNAPASFVSQQNVTAGASQPAQAVPKHIVYDILFSEIGAFEKKAEEKERDGKNATFLRAHHKTKLSLTDPQMDVLARIAAASNARVAKLDEQAAKIISAIRSSYPNGRVTGMQQLPELPPKLKELQLQRDEARVYSRERLREALGNKEFKRIDDFLQVDIERKLKPVGDIHRGMAELKDKQ